MNQLWGERELVVCGGGPLRLEILALIGVLALLSLSACGSSGGGSSTTPALQTGAFWSQVDLPASPDTVSGQPRSTMASLRGVAAQASATPTADFDHVFFLVSGHSLPTPVPGSNLRYAPAPQSTPLVMTVNSAADQTDNDPAGAPGPNSGTGVHLAPVTPGNNVNQLWKAVPMDPGDPTGPFFLRSAASFATNTTANAPSPMVGFGLSAVALDLGYLAKSATGNSGNWWNTSIYLNQSTVLNCGCPSTTATYGVTCESPSDYICPSGPLSSSTLFQQWSYDLGNSQLTNGNGGEAYYDDSITFDGVPTVGVAAPAPSPATDANWYAYPNYYLSYIINQQPNSDPPFPTATATSTAQGETDAAGEQAAYDYLNVEYLCSPGVSTCAPATQTCTRSGVSASYTYAGLRCVYTDFASAGTLSACSNAIGLSNPTSFNGTPISVPDWASVTSQIAAECRYAADVQGVYNIFQSIGDQVFSADSDAITQLVDDLELSSAKNQVNAVPIDIVTGVITTVLAATGDPAAGAFAALMDAGASTALAAGGNTAKQMTETVQAEPSQLYSALEDNFAVLTQASSNGVNKILGDWGRLQTVGQLSEVTGYNALGLTANDETKIENLALQGYKLAVMQLLMPLAFDLQVTVATENSTLKGPPSYDQYPYSTFGATTGSYNIGSFFEPQTVNQSYPDSTVLQTDILDNGANPYELFNGLNGWSGQQMGDGTTDYFPLANLTCQGMVTTLFNATPLELEVDYGAADQNGVVAAPGVDFETYYSASTDKQTNSTGLAYKCSSGSPCTVVGELRSFGYLQMWAGSTDGSENTDLYVNVGINPYGALSIGAFNFGMNDGCQAQDNNLAPFANSIQFYNGYSLSPGFSHNNDNDIKGPDATPGGLWAVVQNPSLQACGVNCP